MSSSTRMIVAIARRRRPGRRLLDAAAQPASARRRANSARKSTSCRPRWRSRRARSPKPSSARNATSPATTSSWSCSARRCRPATKPSSLLVAAEPDRRATPSVGVREHQARLRRRRRSNAPKPQPSGSRRRPPPSSGGSRVPPTEAAAALLPLGATIGAAGPRRDALRPHLQRQLLPRRRLHPGDRLAGPHRRTRRSPSTGAWSRSTASRSLADAEGGFPRPATRTSR